MRARDSADPASTAIRLASSSTSIARVTNPSSPLETKSRGPPTSLTITGSALAWASKITFPNVSVVLGKAKKSADA